MKNPWMKINAVGFMKDLAMGDEPVTLTVCYRPDVASRYWWTLEWTDEKGIKQSVSAQTWDLLFWRATELQLVLEAKYDSS